MEYEFKPLECKFYLKEHGNLFEKQISSYLGTVRRGKVCFLIASKSTC